MRQPPRRNRNRRRSARPGGLRFEPLENRTLLSVGAWDGPSVGPEPMSAAVATVASAVPAPPAPDYQWTYDPMVEAIGDGLAQLYRDYEAAGNRLTPELAEGWPIDGDRIGIKIMTLGAAAGWVDELERIGMEVMEVKDEVVGGLLPVGALKDLAESGCSLHAFAVHSYITKPHTPPAPQPREPAPPADGGGSGLDAATPTVPSHPPEPNPDPAPKWTEAVGGEVQTIYNEYSEFVEDGGRPEDFISRYADSYYLDGSRIYVEVRFYDPSDRAGADATVEAVSAAGLEIYERWGSSHVEGYLSLDRVPVVGQVDGIHVRALEKLWDPAPPPYEPPQSLSPTLPGDPATPPPIVILPSWPVEPPLTLPAEPSPTQPGEPGARLLLPIAFPIRDVLPLPVSPRHGTTPLPDSTTFSIAGLEDLARALTPIESASGHSGNSRPEKRVLTVHDLSLQAMMYD